MRRSQLPSWRCWRWRWAPQGRCTASPRLARQIRHDEAMLRSVSQRETYLSNQVATLTVPTDPLSAYSAVCSQQMTNQSSGITQTYWFPCTSHAQTIPQPAGWSHPAGPGCPTGRPRTCSKLRPAARPCTAAALGADPRRRSGHEHATADEEVWAHVRGESGQVCAALDRGAIALAGTARPRQTRIAQAARDRTGAPAACRWRPCSRVVHADASVAPGSGA